MRDFLGLDEDFEEAPEVESPLETDGKMQADGGVQALPGDAGLEGLMVMGEVVEGLTVGQTAAPADVGFEGFRCCC